MLERLLLASPHMSDEGYELEYIHDAFRKNWIAPLGENVNEFEKAISLRVIDEAWVDHISTMEHLREGIGLRGYGQTNPLQAYTQEGYQIFEKMEDSIDAKISTFLLKAQITQNLTRKPVVEGKENDGKEKAKHVPKKVTKVGRNDLCPCGSGKKYKQCCGK